MMRGGSSIRMLALAAVLAGTGACSIPTLEDPLCAQAQDSVKRFYSAHFDRGGSGTLTAPETRMYVSERLVNELTEPQSGGTSYFTTGETFPSAFSIGACSLRGDQQAEIDVNLLWRTGERSDQRRIRVRAIRAEDKWQIDTVAPL